MFAILDPLSGPYLQLTFSNYLCGSIHLAQHPCALQVHANAFKSPSIRDHWCNLRMRAFIAALSSRSMVSTK